MAAPALRRSSSLPEGSRVFTTTTSSHADLKTSTEDLLHLDPRPPPALRLQLREKVCAAVRRTPKFRFQLILVLLFCGIFALVMLTYYYSHRQRTEAALRNRFELRDRKLRLLTEGGRSVLRGHLGLGFPADREPLDCRFLHPRHHVCSEWKYRARLLVNMSTPSPLNCYHFHWQSLTPEPLRDCFALDGASWYGVGDSDNSTWPLRGNSTDEYYPFVTGNTSRDGLGAIIERYWLSSEGVAIWVDPDVPLFFSLNSSHLCFESRAKTFPYLSVSVPSLSYHLCSGPSIRKVHDAMFKQFFPPLPKSLNSSSSLDFLEQPIWATDPKLGPTLNQDLLQNYANRIMDYGFPRGSVLVETGWQQGKGDLNFNNNTFTKPEDIISILHNKGFKVLLSVSPYVCLSSESFQYGADEKLFITDSAWDVPLLTRWRGEICGILDFLNVNASQWFIGNLDNLEKSLSIDGFFLTGGETLNFPNSLTFPSIINPDQLIRKYLEQDNIVGSSLSFNSQGLLSFVRLSSRPSSWDGLKTVIPSVLALGLIGYPLVNAGSVGGDTSDAPSKELYLRWLQLSAFLPVAQYSVPPGDYDLDVIKASKLLFKVREDKVLPALRKAYYEYLETGAPIVRPLWWEAPNDPSALASNSQFFIGDSILVAPVLEEGSKARDVYLPNGMWFDELQGNSKRGGKWIINYPVPVDKFAYFTKSKENS